MQYALTCRNVTDAVMLRTAEETKREIQFFCKMECNRPFTMSDEVYREAKSEFRLSFAARRNQCLGPTNPHRLYSTHTVKGNGNSQSLSSRSEDDENALLSLLLTQGYPISSTKQLARLYDRDEYDAELDVISRVLAYFEVSSKRIMDVMPMIFETAFVCNFAEQLSRVLISDLKLIEESGFETCKRYGKDEPDIQVKRADYKRQADILSDAMSVISTFFKGNRPT